MTTITFLGGPETGDVAFVDWLGYRFTINQPVECSNAHIIAKARNNRFFRVGGEVAADPPKPIDPLDHDGDGNKGGSAKAPDRMAAARAARAAKLAAEKANAA